MLTLGVVLSAKDMLSPVLNKAFGKLGTFETKIKSVSGFLSKMGTVSLGAGVAIGSGIGNAINTYQELAKAQGEVESLGVSSKGIETITKQAREFSNQFGGTTAPQFVKSAYDIKSGIASLSDTGVAKFTYLSALTGKATKSSTEQMTSLFATGYGIYAKQFDAFGAKTIKGWNKLSQEEKDIKFGEAFSAGIAGAVQLFKTNGSEMQRAIENLGAMATTSNVPLAEQLAILGSMQKTFPSGSEAATAYKGFLSGAISAQEKLNLKFVDSNNQLLSAPKILEKLKEKYGETLDDMEKADIKKAFGTEEGMKFITAFYDNVDTLKDSITQMDKKIKGGTSSVEKMAKKMNKGWEFTILEQRIGNLTSTIGEQFAPIALKASGIIGNFVNKITTWTKAHPELTANIAKGITIFGGFLAVIGTVGIGLSVLTIGIPFLVTQFLTLWGVISFGGGVLKTLLIGSYRVALFGLGITAKLTATAFELLAFSSKLLGGAFKLVGRSILWMGRVLIMNPVIATVTAIAGGAYMIYKHWGHTGNFFKDLWIGIKGAFNEGLNFIKSVISWNPLDTIKTIWDKAMDYFNSKFEWFTNKINTLKNFKISSLWGDDEEENEKEKKKENNSNSHFWSSWFKDDEKKEQKTDEDNKTSTHTSITKKAIIAPLVATQLITAQPNINEDRTFQTKESLVSSAIPKIEDRTFQTKESLVSSVIPKVEDRTFQTKESLVSSVIPKVEDRTFQTKESIFSNKKPIKKSIEKNTTIIEAPINITINTTEKTPEILAHEIRKILKQIEKKATTKKDTIFEDEEI